MQTCKPDGSAFGACMGEVLPTAENCLTAQDENCDGMTLACAAPLWSKQFGASSDDVGFDVAVDTFSGNVVTTGYFKGSVDFGGGALTSTAQSEDIYIAKYDPAGAYLWSKRAGDGADQVGR